MSLRSSIIAIASVLALSSVSYAATEPSFESATLVKNDRILFVNGEKEHGALLRGLKAQLEANGWKETEVGKVPDSQNPWCRLNIGQNGILIRGECYSPHDGFGYNIRDMFGAFDHEKKVIDLSPVNAMMDRLYLSAILVQGTLALRSSR